MMFLRKNSVIDRTVTLEVSEVEQSSIEMMDLLPCDLLEDLDFNVVINLTELEKQLQSCDWLTMKAQITDIVLLNSLWKSLRGDFHFECRT